MSEGVRRRIDAFPKQMQKSGVHISTLGTRLGAVQRAKWTAINAQSTVFGFLIWQFHWNRCKGVAAPVAQHGRLSGPFGVRDAIGQSEDFRHFRILTFTSL